ncbi:unnamed protein product [Meloidogyne enterolobii]
MEQYYKLLKNEYKSERELMSGQKEIVVSAEEKSERSVLATTSDLSRNYSDIPSSLKSDKPKIKKEPVVAETNKSVRLRPKLHTTDKG